MPPSHWIPWFALAATLLRASAGTNAPPIRVNSLGFLPGQEKRATIAGNPPTIRLMRDADGVEAWSGGCTTPSGGAYAAGQLRVADFSTVTAPGRYHLEAEGLPPSGSFSIGDDVWREAFVAASRAFHLWRCGSPVAMEFQGHRFAHAACHTNDAWLDLVGGGHVRKAAVGGWHDAGDYNKYVVNAAASVGLLLKAWEDFTPAIRRTPPGAAGADGGLPEFLAEIRWELEWLLTMQAGDGSVYHKLTTRRFGGFVPPEAETEDRFFTPVSSTATAGFTAVTAQAARVFRGDDPGFADRCLAAAAKSWAWLSAHPEERSFDPAGTTTGPYAAPDAPARLWAAAAWWEATGDSSAAREAANRLRATGPRIEVDWDWGNPANLGALTYLFSPRTNADAALQQALRGGLLATASQIAATAAGHPYGRPLGTSYYWGANGSVARQVVLLTAAHRLDPRPEFRQAALDALGWLFGRNPAGRSMVTGLGYQPPLHPHDRRSSIDPSGPPWPGCLVGGPHPGPEDWQDVQADYRTNEIAINWNAALVYALAASLPGRVF